MEETLNYIKAKIGDFVPETACILGSGLGELACEFENAIKISFSDIPGFKKPTIEGHAGNLVFVKSLISICNFSLVSNLNNKYLR